MKYLFAILLLFCIACGSRKGRNGDDSAYVEAEPRSDVAPKPANGSGSGAVELVFGKFCGHCLGNCTQMYRITDQLFADTTDAYLRKGREAMNFNVRMSQTNYNNASKLLAMIPRELYELHDSTYGCPDCADQCGYYLEIHKDGRTGRYRIDTQHYNLPAWLKEFPGQLGTLIQGLNTP